MRGARGKAEAPLATVTHVRLIEGLGHGLDESAMAAARAMTFEAAQRCGRAVSATFKVGFTFSPSAT